MEFPLKPSFIPASAGVCDTLGFKVNVPKISKADDRAVGIKITFDTTEKSTIQKIIIKNEDGEGVPGASLSVVLYNKNADALHLFADENGEVVVNNFLENESYTISISSIGYEVKNTEVSFLNSNEHLIRLRKQYVNYEPVVVKSNGVVCRRVSCRCFIRTIMSCEYVFEKKTKDRVVQRIS